MSSSPTTFRATYANAGYNGPQSVIIKIDQTGNFRPPSAASGSYATIASLNKYQMPDITKTYNCEFFYLFIHKILTKNRRVQKITQ